MFVYLGIFAYFATAAIFDAFREIKLRTSHLWIPAICLVILIGFRWHIGVDWTTYARHLRYAGMAHYLKVTSDAEPSYELLNSIAALADWGLWFPDLICAAIFTYGLIVFCREQPNPWLALVVAVPYLIICVGMGYTRQSAAVGLLLVALTQFARGAQVSTFVSLGLATTFHVSAIALPPLFGMASARRALVQGVLLAIFGIALYFAFSQRIATRMSDYATTRYIPAGVIPRMVMNIVPALIFLPLRGRFVASRDEARLWTIFSLVALLTIPMLFLVSSKTIVDRIGIYLTPLQIFVLSRAPVVFGRSKRQNLLVVLAVIFYSLAAELVWLQFGNEAHAWLPYRNYIWERWFS